MLDRVIGRVPCCSCARQARSHAQQPPCSCYNLILLQAQKTVADFEDADVRRHVFGSAALNVAAEKAVRDEVQQTNPSATVNKTCAGAKLMAFLVHAAGGRMRRCLLHAASIECSMCKPHHAPRDPLVTHS